MHITIKGGTGEGKSLAAIAISRALESLGASTSIEDEPLTPKAWRDKTNIITKGKPVLAGRMVFIVTAQAKK